MGKRFDISFRNFNETSSKWYSTDSKLKAIVVSIWLSFKYQMVTVNLRAK